MANSPVNWLVSAYIYNPDGSFAGMLRQKRHHETLPDGRTRATINSVPGSELGAHPMAAFSGEWVYETLTEGRQQRYQGPDMIGSALKWGSDTVTASGVWTRLGHNFTTTAIQLTPERVLTTTRFFNAREAVAILVSIGVPDPGDANADDYPRFTASFSPAESALIWEGMIQGFNPAGEAIFLGEEARRYHFSERRGLTIHESDRVWKFDDMENRYGVQESPGDYGIAKRSGWLFEIEHFTPPKTYSRIEILDNAGDNLIVITRTLENESLTYLSVMRLKPRK